MSLYLLLTFYNFLTGNIPTVLFIYCSSVFISKNSFPFSDCPSSVAACACLHLPFLLGWHLRILKKKIFKRTSSSLNYLYFFWGSVVHFLASLLCYWLFLNYLLIFRWFAFMNERLDGWKLNRWLSVHVLTLFGCVSLETLPALNG